MQHDRKWILLIALAACGGNGHASMVDSGNAQLDSPVVTPDAPPDSPPPAPISLRFTEINPASQTDLVELVAVAGGKLDGFKVLETTNSTFTFEFPAGYTVAKNDVIVLHLAGTCTDDPGNAASCGTVAPFSAAWDFSMPGQLTYSGKVFELHDAADALIDAVPFVDSAGVAPGTYVAAVKSIQSRAAWNPTPCIDDPSTGMAKDRFCRNISVIWDGLKTDNSNSVIRIGPDALKVPGAASQWSAALPSTFGTHP